ncbi:NACHT domain-containing protein [Hymenobacter sp. M29]|uniref:NACHT domain-containing protein n=1 Tax=Hymenobacter mellowenesis TaxID=3063995 RepID=A0ABT9AGL8_9BACT|nr:NACHT domain-containing protein [Hymenobacter sp. M29]MDO7849012.1 NACHT domain-containing protein [Hymenobacter sp. M29]
MDINLTSAKDLLASTKPLVDPILAVLLAPKIKAIEGFLRKRGIDKKLSEAAIEESFRAYLTRAYQKFCIMNILVFPNQQIIIKDIYQPLTLVSNKDHRSFKINAFERGYIEPYERILLSDTAGMGKSTLMKWIGASIIEQNLSIPILIELKRLGDKHKVIDEICTQLGDIFGDFDKEVIAHLINQGEFTFLLDGFDEVRNEYRGAVIEDIKDFIQKSGNNWYILTSRPESALTAFGDFQVFNIRPLTPDESYQLIKKYDGVNLNKVGDQLIRDIKGKLAQVREFLVNPFLVSLLYKTYTYNKDIPSKKTTFYEEVYGALYKHHDLSKDGFKRNKKSGLDFQDFRAVVNQLAFDTAKAGEVEYSEQELIKLLDDVRPKCAGITFKSSDFAEDIELNVPLFNREGNVLKWAHKSLQDFFAASYISASAKKETIVELIYKSQRSNYLNIIDFLFEMEYKLVRNIILYEIAQSFIDFCDNSFKNLSGISRDLIRKRQEIAFDVSSAFIRVDNEDLFADDNHLSLKERLHIKRNERLFGYNLASNPESNDQSLHASGMSFRHEVINILFKKGLSIVKPLSLAKQPVDEILYSIPLDTAFVFDERKENPLNERKQFSDFTDLLKNDRRITGSDLCLLDYDACVQLVKLVDESKAYEEEKSELDGL